ncbi:hypothetical protein [Fodinibius sediminis]|uniref:hypothetical protein n=1 Tax=Fodinibius sediminis TaxID=1214077 RepID=UPI00163DB81C|nr:hypothetical protein [Fodinibius sediminis]
MSTSLIITACLLTACSENPSEPGINTADVQVEEDGIRVTNERRYPICYFAVGRYYAAQISWAPVSSPENEILPRQNKFIPFSEIGGYEPGSDILFYYWSGKDATPEDIRRLVIKAGY